MNDIISCAARPSVARCGAAACDCGKIDAEMVHRNCPRREICVPIIAAQKRGLVTHVVANAVPISP
jgi:hypothetical protein